MKFEWYLFEQSYLLDLAYNLLGCTLTLTVDAKITFEHPKFDEISIMSNNFREITIKFEGVQYFRVINSLHLLTNPNEDLGSIEQLELKTVDLISGGLSISTANNRVGLSLDLSESKIVTVYTDFNNLTFLDFVSEMISLNLVLINTLLQKPPSSSY